MAGRFTDHKPGRLSPRQCPSNKHVYEEAKHALRSIRWMKEHGEIRTGHPYRCSQCPGWHIASGTRLRRKRK